MFIPVCGSQRSHVGCGPWVERWFRSPRFLPSWHPSEATPPCRPSLILFPIKRHFSHQAWLVLLLLRWPMSHPRWSVSLPVTAGLQTTGTVHWLRPSGNPPPLPLPLLPPRQARMAMPVRIITPVNVDVLASFVSSCTDHLLCEGFA